jgi:predicted nucleic acid-binding protein
VRTPSQILVIDSAVLVAVLFSGRTGTVKSIARARKVAVSDRAIEETKRRVVLGLKLPSLLQRLDDLSPILNIEFADSYGRLLAAAERTLRDSVGSRNGSTRDAHVLALAWFLDADIWSPDRDFAGTGVASWSTPNLVRALTAPS